MLGGPSRRWKSSFFFLKRFFRFPIRVVSRYTSQWGGYWRVSWPNFFCGKVQNRMWNPYTSESFHKIPKVDTKGWGGYWRVISFVMKNGDESHGKPNKKHPQVLFKEADLWVGQICKKWKLVNIHPPKTKMTMTHLPFEDVFPIENGWFSNVILVFQGGFGVFRQDLRLGSKDVPQQIMYKPKPIWAITHKIHVTHTPRGDFHGSTT